MKNQLFRRELLKFWKEVKKYLFFPTIIYVLLRFLIPPDPAFGFALSVAILCMSFSVFGDPEKVMEAL